MPILIFAILAAITGRRSGWHVAPRENADHIGERGGIGDLQLCLRAVLSVKMGTLAFQCDDCIAHDGIVNDARNRFTFHGDRKQRAKGGKTGSIIERASIGSITKASGASQGGND